MVVRKFDSDRLRAQTTFFLVNVALVILYLLITFVAWAWLHTSGTPSAASVQTFWTFQSCGLVFLLAMSWIGYQPATRVRVSDAGVEVRSGNKAAHLIEPARLREVSRIPALHHHQHYRLYEETRSFVSKPFPTVVLILTETNPWVLGVRPAEQNLLMTSIGALIQAQAVESVRQESLVA
jgi:hypothetical protein